MDLEDLFKQQLSMNEHQNLGQDEDEEFKQSNDQSEQNLPLVIPEFGSCSVEGEEENNECNQQKQQLSNEQCCTQKGEKCCQPQKLSNKQKKRLQNAKNNLKKQQEEEEEKLEKGQSQQKNKLLMDQKDNMCFKCKINVANFTNKSDKVCKFCFEDQIVHRFKSSLRGNLKIWKDDLNLVCISGGSNSMALLNLLYKSLFGNQQQRKMFFKVHILYIDEGAAVYGWNEQKRLENLNFIIETCKNYSFDYTIVPLEWVYVISPEKIDLKRVNSVECKIIEEEKRQDEIQHSQPHNMQEVINKVLTIEEEENSISNLREKLSTLIKSVSSVSSQREDLILYLKRWIISEFALKYNFKKILFGTSGHKVATQLLAQLAKGRGMSVSHEISYIDDKNFGGRITFMNPMREFLQKEIALYNHINKVQVLQQRSLAQLNNSKVNAPSFASTDQLIEKFFNNLQDKFNVNTVPTVVRLTNKLQKADYEQKLENGSSLDYQFCPLCLGVRDKVNNLLEIGSTIKSIKIGENGQNIPCSIKSSDDWLTSDIEKAFCFGCKRLSISAANRQQFIDLLPNIVKINAQKTIAQEEVIQSAENNQIQQ